MLQRFREVLDLADPAQVREVIGQMVAKVECWFDRVPKKKRAEYPLSRGLIHLRDDLQIVRVVCRA
jgi:hypothetical protein